MSVETISHEGIIIGFKEGDIEIKILSKGACGSCQIKSACNMAEQAEKVLRVPHPTGHVYEIGQKVNIMMSERQGNKAVIYAYLIPVVVLLATLFFMIGIGLNDGISALISLATLGIYYLILYLFKGKIKKTFSYDIE